MGVSGFPTQLFPIQLFQGHGENRGPQYYAGYRLLENPTTFAARIWWPFRSGPSGLVRIEVKNLALHFDGSNERPDLIGVEFLCTFGTYCI
jgi:hypothetical protein